MGGSSTTKAIKGIQKQKRGTRVVFFGFCCLHKIFIKLAYSLSHNNIACMISFPLPHRSSLSDHLSLSLSIQYPHFFGGLVAEASLNIAIHHMVCVERRITLKGLYICSIQLHYINTWTIL